VLQVFALVREALAGAIPHARLVTLQGAGHLLPQEDPTAVAAVIADVAWCARDRDCSQAVADRE